MLWKNAFKINLLQKYVSDERSSLRNMRKQMWVKTSLLKSNIICIISDMRIIHPFVIISFDFYSYRYFNLNKKLWLKTLNFK